MKSIQNTLAVDAHKKTLLFFQSLKTASVSLSPTSTPPQKEDTGRISAEIIHRRVGA
jgi:hypothetical protein